MPRREEYESRLLSLRLLVKALPTGSLSMKAKTKVNCDAEGPAVPSASYCLQLHGFASCLHPTLTLTTSPVSQTTSQRWQKPCVIFPMNCFTESARGVAEKEAGLCAQKRDLEPLIVMKPRLLSHLADKMLFKKVGAGSGPKKKKGKVNLHSCLHYGQLWKSTSASFLSTRTSGTF